MAEIERLAPLDGALVVAFDYAAAFAALGGVLVGGRAERGGHGGAPGAADVGPQGLPRCARKCVAPCQMADLAG